MVIDASVAFKWLADEAGSASAIGLIGQPLSAPSLITAELGNALWKKTQRGEFARTASFAIELADLTRLVAICEIAPLAARALEMAVSLDYPIYHCFYLALAEAEGTRLVTADRRFAAVVRASRWAPEVEMLQ